MPVDTGKIAVFGGTGFLGRRVARRLAARGFAVRIVARHPRLPSGLDGSVELARADIREPASVTAALAGCQGAVNAVSLYVERATETFQAVHVEAARRLAEMARTSGMARLVHLSGVGADAHAPSPYIRSRGQGENAVREAFPAAILVRPSAMVGPNDALVTPLAEMLRRTPVFPLFGDGETKLQPAHVGDVAETITRLFASPDHGGATFELGGADVITFRALLKAIAWRLGRRTILVPIPFPIWYATATLAELLPSPPITRNQVELMRHDNVATGRWPGFGAVGVRPRPLAVVLSQAIPTASA